MTYEMSERRACQVIRADRKMVRYRSGRRDDAALRERLRQLAAEQRRFGYRRLHVLLRGEGHILNRKKTQRLYREEGLSVRRRRGRKRATGTRVSRDNLDGKRAARELDAIIARRGTPG